MKLSTITTAISDTIAKVEYVADAFIALPESIREARSLLGELHDRAKAQATIRTLRGDRAELRERIETRDKRIAELEAERDALRNGGLERAAKVSRLESELSTLRTKSEPSIPEPVTPERPWVACTAEEARANPDGVEYFHTLLQKWRPNYDTCSFEPGFAYRSRAQLSEWVEVGSEIRDRVGMPSVSRPIGGGLCKVRRSEIEVGTVLG